MPWCGNTTWFPSDGDDPRDHGRIQMSCDTSDCASRETELIIMRGEGAHDRADVRALHALDEGVHAGDEAPPMEFDIGDPLASEAFEHAARRRVEYRKYDKAFTLDVN